MALTACVFEDGERREGLEEGGKEKKGFD